MLPLLLKTHIWESNIWNGLVWCLQQHQPAPTPCRLSAFMFLLQEQCTGSRNASSWLRTGEKQRHKAGSDGSVTCVAVPGQRDEQEGLGICSELVLWRLRRGNKGRVENNRTWQWHWDNLWSYLGIFNWPVSFSHLMHFHEDSSLPLVLSSPSSLDSPADSLSAFLCFVSPPLSHCKAALSCLAFPSEQKDRFSRGAVWESLMLLSTKREIWYSRGDCQWPKHVCHLSQLFFAQI